MASRQSTTTPRTGAATAAARKSSVTPTSIPATALSKHNTRRTSRDARGEKRSEATAAAAAHEEAGATSTAVVGVKPQSSMMVRSGRGRSGSRSGDLGPNSRQPSARDGALSATSSADTAYSPPVGPRQGAPLPLGTRWSPLARAARAGGPSATGNGNFSANKAGRVQHPVFVGNPDQAKTQEDQVDGAAAKGGTARVKQSQAGLGAGRVVRRVNGKSAPSPRTPARAQPDTVQGGKRKRKGAPSPRGAEAASTAAAAPAASAAAQLAAAKPPHATASSTGAQPFVAEKGFPMQVKALKKAGPGNEAAVERFDKFPRMLQDKEKCALLRAIERCPEPDDIASYITKGRAKYEFWRENILTPVVKDLEGDNDYRGDAREVFGSIRYFTAIYNWVRNQKKQLVDFYANPDRSGKDDFDFSGQTALMEARRKAFKDRLPTTIGGKKASGKRKEAPGKGKAASGKGKEVSGKGKEASGNGKEVSGREKWKGKRKAAAIGATAAAAVATPASSPRQTQKPSGTPTEKAGGDEGVIRKGKSRRMGSKDLRVPTPGTQGGNAAAPSLVNGAGGDGGGSGNIDDGGGESKDGCALFFPEEAYEKAKGDAVVSAVSAPRTSDPNPSNFANRPGDKESNTPSKTRNRGGTNAVRQEADGSTNFEKRIAEDLAKLAEAVQGGAGGASSTTAVPVPNALDIAAQRLQTAKFLWQLKKEGCQSVEVDDKTIWELALKSADI